MKSQEHNELVPKRALQAAIFLVCFSLAAVSVATLTGYKWEWHPEGEIVSQRNVEFLDVGDGGVAVRDAGTGQTLGQYTFTENAFMRMVMLSFRHERAGIPGEHHEPFQIQKWADGRVTVADPVTGRSFEMAAFGRHQVEAFGGLLR